MGFQVKLKKLLDKLSASSSGQRGQSEAGAAAPEVDGDPRRQGRAFEVAEPLNPGAEPPSRSSSGTPPTFGRDSLISSMAEVEARQGLNRASPTSFPVRAIITSVKAKLGLPSLESPKVTTDGSSRARGGTQCTGGGHGELPPTGAGGAAGGPAPQSGQVPQLAAAAASPLARRVATTAIHRRMSNTIFPAADASADERVPPPLLLSPPGALTQHHRRNPVRAMRSGPLSLSVQAAPFPSSVDPPSEAATADAAAAATTSHAGGLGVIHASASASAGTVATAVPGSATTAVPAVLAPSPPPSARGSLPFDFGAGGGPFLRATTGGIASASAGAGGRSSSGTGMAATADEGAAGASSGSPRGLLVRQILPSMQQQQQQQCAQQPASPSSGPGPAQWQQHQQPTAQDAAAAASGGGASQQRFSGSGGGSASGAGDAAFPRCCPSPTTTTTTSIRRRPSRLGVSGGTGPGSSSLWAAMPPVMVSPSAPIHTINSGGLDADVAGALLGPDAAAAPSSSSAAAAASTAAADAPGAVHDSGEQLYDVAAAAASPRHHHHQQKQQQRAPAPRASSPKMPLPAAAGSPTAAAGAGSVAATAAAAAAAPSPPRPWPVLIASVLVVRPPSARGSGGGGADASTTWSVARTLPHVLSGTLPADASSCAAGARAPTASAAAAAAAAAAAGAAAPAPATVAASASAATSAASSASAPVSADHASAGDDAAVAASGGSAAAGVLPERTSADGAIAAVRSAAAKGAAAATVAVGVGSSVDGAPQPQKSSQPPAAAATALMHDAGVDAVGTVTRAGDDSGSVMSVATPPVVEAGGAPALATSVAGAARAAAAAETASAGFISGAGAAVSDGSAGGVAVVSAAADELRAAKQHPESPRTVAPDRPVVAAAPLPMSAAPKQQPSASVNAPTQPSPPVAPDTPATQQPAAVSRAVSITAAPLQPAAASQPQATAVGPEQEGTSPFNTSTVAATASTHTPSSSTKPAASPLAAVVAASSSGVNAASMKRESSGRKSGFVPRSVPPCGTLHVSPAAPPAMLHERLHGAWVLADYQVVRKLYEGYASSVFKAHCLQSRTDVVLKAYCLTGLSPFLTHQVLRELDIHARLVHDNIVHLIGTFREGDLLVFVQEYMRGGSLARVCKELGGRMTEFQAMHLVLVPLLAALEYLHARGIVHRDIKPDNLLFTPDWQLKLCDFGVSVCIHEERAVTKTGSKDYMAPEVVLCPLKRGPEDNKDNLQLAYTPAVDVWSLGVLMYQLLVGFTPFPAGPPPLRAAGTEPADGLRFPSSISEPARAFVRACLRLHPGDRPTVRQLLHHEWVCRALEGVSLENEEE